MTVGTMVAAPRIALVQTPHHFFSPDPFERNLRVFRTVPNEGELFYGLLQDGNDLWDATFFCGSCAVIRRTAIEQIGGIATETVTEDAHTALRLHSLGWESAYINIPQAAGLATESLSAHIGQRIRWARGMAQIFRVNNPLTTPGLKIGQRLCYLNAMAHYFYGIPRLVFLTSPLAFLLFNAEIIRAQGLLILAYAAPHVLIAITTNSRLQGRYRHSFWAEVYETVLAIFIIVPTTLAVINPKLGTFNVTAKGGIIDKDYFDANIARPYYLLYLLNTIGLFVGILRLIFGDAGRTDTVTLNMGWTVYNLLIIGAALCVASETKQVRRAVRVRTRVPMAVRRSPTSEVFETETLDLSQGGLSMSTPENLGVEVGEPIEIALTESEQMVWIPATVRRAGSSITTIEFENLDSEQERQIVGTIFGRANSWLAWRDEQTRDRPLTAFWAMSKFSFKGSFKFYRWVFQQMAEGLRRGLRLRTAGPAALAAMLIGSGFVMPQDAQAAPSPPPAPVTADELAKSAAHPAPVTTDLVFTESTRQLKLEDLGQRYPLRLTTVFGQASLPISVRRDQVVTKATLHLEYAHSPSLIPHLSHLNLLLNDELLTTLPFTEANAGGGTLDLPLNPLLFGEFNQIRFEAVQHYTDRPDQCEDPTHTSLWSIVSNRSYVTLTFAQLPPAPALGGLPRPLFDPADIRPLNLPVSLTTAPGRDALTAAAIVASWFGAQADYRGAEFPALLGHLPPGHGVVLRSGEAFSEKFGPGAPMPRLRVVVNPDAPQARLLLIEAPDESGLLLAARAFVMGAYAADGASAEVRSVELPPLAKRDAAPRWLDPAQPTLLKTLNPNALSVRGLSPGPLDFDFRLPPDIYFLKETGAILDLRYRYSPVTGMGSSLSTLLNSGFLAGSVLADAGKPGLNRNFDNYDEAQTYLPASRLGSQNRLSLQYEFRRNVSKPCEDFNNDALGGSVDPDSTIRFQDYTHYAPWPDLVRFRDGGLPFAVFPDLAQSAFLVADVPDEDSLTALLTVAGHIGHVTGMAALRVVVDGAAAAANYADRDLLVVGRATALPQLSDWKDQLPITFDEKGASLRSFGAVSRLQASVEGRDLTGALQYSGRVLLDAGRSVGALIGATSPLNSSRAMVVVTAGDLGRVSNVTEALIDPARNQFMLGNLALTRGAETTGYQLGSEGGLGRLPWTFAIRHWLKLHPYLVAPISIALAVMAALILFPLLRARARRRLARNAAKK
jgi:cellulose synthase (UDP-forming)